MNHVSEDSLAVGAIALRIEDVHMPELVHGLARNDGRIGVLCNDLQKLPITGFRTSNILLGQDRTVLVQHLRFDPFEVERLDGTPGGGNVLFLFVHGLSSS